MRKPSFFEASFVLSVFLFPVVVCAQQRGGAASMMSHVAAAPAVVHASTHSATGQVVHTTPHGPVSTAHSAPVRTSARPVYTKGNGHVSPVAHSNGNYNGYVAPLASGTSGDYGVPGLGFDYSHYAAVHPGSRNRSNYSGAIYPVYFGGGYYYPGGYLDNGVPQEVADDAQQGDTASTETNAAAVVPVEQSAAYERMRVRSNSAPAPPLAPSPEYIFVRRDGTVFFAVAYSWLNGNLQYVTQDGLRKLVSLSTLDLDATTQFNEQRGIEFRSPA